MSNRSILTKLAIAGAAVTLTACQQDNGTSGHATKPEGTPKAEVADAPKTVIARVPVNPQTAEEAKIQLVTSGDDVSKIDAATIEKAYGSGTAMNIQSDGNMVGATTLNGQNFALFGCPTAYQPYAQYPYSQYGQYPQNGYYPQQQGGLGGIFQSLLGGGGLGGLFGGLMPQGGLFSNFLGLFQNIQPFMQSGMFPVSLPFGQMFGNQYCNNGYNTPGTYPQMPGTPYTPSFGTTPYPYYGQYQQGPYNYYTYGQQPIGTQPGYNQPVYGQPVNGQPVNGQPVNGQPVYGQPVNGQYPQYGTPYNYPSGGQYNYTPYPVGNNYGSVTQ